MKLITAHRILIAAAIAFFLLYAALNLRHYMAGGSSAMLVQSLGSAAVALGLVVYFRSLRGWGRR